MTVIRTVIILAVCYLIGGIPWGVVIGGRHGVNVLERGSGSTGATNVYRTVGKAAAALVLLLDLLKGYAGAMVGGSLSSMAPDVGAVLGGIAAIAGHCYSPFLGFRGGKGVATSAGVALCLIPKFVAIGAVLFAIIVVVTRYASVASLTAVTVVVIMVLLRASSIAHKLFALAAGSIILYRHVPNIQRLVAGRENRIDRRQ